MKKKLSTWSKRIIGTLFLSFSILILIVLNPSFLYANKTEVGNFTVFHQQELDENIEIRLKEIEKMVQESEIYDPEFHIEILLNDGSAYPAIIDRFLGPGFGFGYLNKAVFRGEANFEENYVDIRGYRWRLDQLFVHEMIHCQEQNFTGFWNSNPIAGHPQWIWEGYAEYIAKKDDQPNLGENIRHYLDSDPSLWEIPLKDGFMAPRNYYLYGIMVQYLTEVKKQSFKEMLSEARNENNVVDEMMNWYESNY